MIRFFAILAVALVVPAVVPATAGNAFGQAAYVHEMAGTVTGTLNSVTRQLKTGDLISAGTTVSTGDKSRAVIKFEDGQIMALAERSSFRIVEYRYVKERVRDSNAVFALLQGGMRFITGVIGSTNRNAFRLTAGTATIGIRGTEGNVYIDIAQAVTAAVAAGEIALTTAQGTQNIGAGETSGPVTAAVQQAFSQLSAQLLPINTPVVVAASAAAAAAAAEAARLGTAAAIAEAQRLLDIAIQAAQEAYKQAIDGGAAPSDRSSLDTTSPTSTSSSSPTGAAGAGGGGGGGSSGSSSGSSGGTTCTPTSASPC